MEKEIKDKIIIYSAVLISVLFNILVLTFCMLLTSLIVGSHIGILRIFFDMFTYSRLSEVPIWFLVYVIFSVTLTYKYCTTKIDKHFMMLLIISALNYVVIYQMTPFKQLISWIDIYFSILKVIF